MLHIYISPTGRNYAVSYWRKILHIYTSPTGRNYAVSYWRKILHIKSKKNTEGTVTWVLFITTFTALSKI